MLTKAAFIWSNAQIKKIILRNIIKNFVLCVFI